VIGFVLPVNSAAFGVYAVCFQWGIVLESCLLFVAAWRGQNVRPMMRIREATMNDLIAARSQMAMSLAFHIIFAAVGVSLPLMMTIAEWRWMSTGDSVYLKLAKRWAKGTTILFAIGALSGTVLSFELGLLWPRFMQYAGSVIGMPFSLEGFAFFTEAIFLGIYLYGWSRVPGWLNLLSGAIVTISGVLSAVFVTFANGWMNTPTGFDLVNGKVVNIRPFATMLNPAGIPEAVHMVLAAYTAAGFAAAGIHAWLLMRRGRNRLDEVALGIALTVAGAAVLMQSVSGDALARMVAANQPMKLASLEGQLKTERGAPLRIGGIPFPDLEETKYAIEIPHGLSLLAFHEPNALIKGLDQEPKSDWPNVRLVHISFQIMVGCGSLLSAFAVTSGWLFWRRRSLATTPLFLKAAVIVGPLGFVALEAGWMVTELGRQPWIIYHLLRTKDAVTSMPGLSITFGVMSFIFVKIPEGYAILKVLAANPLSDTKQAANSQGAPAPQGGAATRGTFAPVLDSEKRAITKEGFVKNGPVVFRDIAEKAGLTTWSHTMGTPQKNYILETTGSGVALLDYDNDGWLDIYLVNGSTFDALSGKTQAPQAALFHNNHDGTFTNVAAKAGVSKLLRTAAGKGAVPGNSGLLTCLQDS
jgi:cytochrome d ubiquinol oxidase subunit I